MIEQAIKKINDEMQKKPDDAYLEALGHYVIDRCGDENIAAVVMQEEKTLAAAMDGVSAIARKKGGSVIAMTDNEVFAIVAEYFGFEHSKEPRPAKTAAPKTPAVVVDFDSFF